MVQPRRPDHLVDLAFPSFGNKTLQGYIPAGEAISRIRDLIVIVRPDFMLAGPDRCNFEYWLPRLAQDNRDDAKLD